MSGQDEQQDKADLDESISFWGTDVLEGPGRRPERDPVFWLWPENVEAWDLFMEVQTEWRGAGVREGLDKAGVERIMWALRISRRNQRQRFQEIRVMERAALQEWAKKERDAK